MTVWERLRNPCGWRAGAKQISVDAMIPIFAVPSLAVIAAQTVLSTVIIFVATPILVYYLHHNFLRFLLRTKFFLMWTITSVVMLMLIFEISVVPLLEILPEENLVFITCVVGGIWCGYMTRLNADSATQETTLTQGLELGEGSGELCITCRRRAPPKAHHCRMCQTCILNREYHCKWLDCCIGSSNLKWYLGCLFFSAIAFIYGSNLTMTSVCHPFILIGTVLLPDDCSDVYHQLDIALCFISALYSLLVGLVVVCYLMYHLWLIYLGTTSNERRLLETGSPYDHGMLKNVSRLFCCKT
ncbi:putative palmitoyltransferase ZDHHC23 [Habropoda laboriosa]|uniref:Palmitoyltransferase n=1 Tax=Habropoda laboriosa TaxID=597456 RepID=A0A0L7RDY7_9HYME|nr:PREDICTED: palmitoyltransferase ZDHHC23 [Habropoda laboriosa]KOC69034.1 putative palmitoyltransferase ZDHHC23 [Habropoda laboriosa]